MTTIGEKKSKRNSISMLVAGTVLGLSIILIQLFTGIGPFSPGFNDFNKLKIIYFSSFLFILLCCILILSVSLFEAPRKYLASLQIITLFTKSMLFIPAIGLSLLGITSIYLLSSAFYSFKISPIIYYTLLIISICCIFLYVPVAVVVHIIKKRNALK